MHGVGTGRITEDERPKQFDGLGLAGVEGTIRDVVKTELHRMQEFQAELIRGEHPVC